MINENCISAQCGRGSAGLGAGGEADSADIAPGAQPKLRSAVDAFADTLVFLKEADNVARYSQVLYFKERSRQIEI